MKVKCPNCHVEFEIESFEDVNIQGWKGKSKIDISEQEGYWNVIEHRKSKETSETYENEHLIPKINVDTLWKLIRENCQLGVDYKYKYLVRMVLEHYKFHITEGQSLEKFMEAFNGGRWRAKYFFLYLYYPLKILEKKGLIVYYGRGGIQRLSNEYSFI